MQGEGRKGYTDRPSAPAALFPERPATLTQRAPPGAKPLVKIGLRN